MILEGSVWAVYQAGVRTTQPSLYSTNISDYFNNTYTLSLVDTIGTRPSATVTLTRIGCGWAGSATIGGQDWTFTLLSYSNCGGDDLGWSIFGVVPASPLGNIFSTFKLDGDDIPITQGTPVGTYGAGFWNVVAIY